MLRRSRDQLQPKLFNRPSIPCSQAPQVAASFGQLTPLSGNLEQVFFRIAIARALGLLLSLGGMLAVLFGSWHGRFPPCSWLP
jgi:hypothetical protein